MKPFSEGKIPKGLSMDLSNLFLRTGMSASCIRRLLAGALAAGQPQDEAGLVALRENRATDFRNEKRDKI